MSRPKGYHCSVVGCNDQHISLHRLPASEEQRAKWIHFIFDGNVPPNIGKNLYVCASHFLTDCFSNLGQLNKGLATKLFLHSGSVPTVRCQTSDGGNAGTSGQLQPAVLHVACQTDPPKGCTVATQLSMRTLQPHFRSRGTQKTVSCTDFGVGTSTTAQLFLIPTPMKKPCKRPRSEVEEDADRHSGST